ncbi:hypothetical protein DQ238_08520 [Geodermatophilus sp. TF02-6]|nr:hypothetical protein DQ238_08520 [Geodermatophilus sp. TF02-6]
MRDDLQVHPPEHRQSAEECVDQPAVGGGGSLRVEPQQSHRPDRSQGRWQHLQAGVAIGAGDVHAEVDVAERVGGPAGEGPP